jgi:hypothetical protein
MIWDSDVWEGERDSIARNIGWNFARESATERNAAVAKLGREGEGAGDF